ncbi:VOC family protein [Phytoactinopolyspora halotolerans]|uniref:Bleomycin resistance protein n=1 Tax=Phytoactinopolyspora halotolerans TaxID=1981512 RepID=A0A6L9S7E0_9ACTN|nr:VOC family protein [Phytoactinopolyspora halotolerans]NEE01096.1 bleomycin resistance protein [Phytoactinopolyspora halotolerans]
MKDAAFIRKIDCVRIPVPDLDQGLDFYCSRLGHELIWRTATQAGLRFPESDAELVLQTEHPEHEIDLLVESVDQALEHIEAAGGSCVSDPIEIPVGRVAVVHDPFGNPFVLIELSKGRYTTDTQGNVTGVET